MKERKQARQYALQALYEWGMSKADPHDICARYLAAVPVQSDQNTSDDWSTRPFDRGYFQTAFLGAAGRATQSDEQFQPFLSRQIHALTPIEHAILRLATWELAERLDIPYKVVLNEAVELAKIFGAADAHKFINGVLDPLSAEIRKTERT